MTVSMEYTMSESPSAPPPLHTRIPLPLRRSRWLWVGAICGSILLLCTVAAGVLYTGTLQRALLAIEPTCTVGITGTAATLTIEGWTANQDCQTIVSGHPSFLGTLDSSRVYLYTTGLTNPVVCELDRQGRHLIVRDEGVLKLVGSALCRALQESTSTAKALAPQASAQPQPTSTTTAPQATIPPLPTATATTVATVPPAPPAVATPPGTWCRNDGYLSTNPACEIYPSPYQPQAGERTVAEACDTGGCSLPASPTIY